MAEPSTTHAQQENFAAQTAQYLQNLQSLTTKAVEQQVQFQINQSSAQELEHNLNTPNYTTQQNQTQNENQNSNSQSQHTQQSQPYDEYKDLERKISNIHIQPPYTANAHFIPHNQSNPTHNPRTGILDSTQGQMTITHNYRQVKGSHYQSHKYKDFASMHTILRPELLDGCDKLNFVHPSKIQAEAIPRCVADNHPNLIGQAHHGSGKTATFVLIMLQRIDESCNYLQGLVVVHSRELAIQTYTVCQSLGQFIHGLKNTLALKGERIPMPWDCQICVGTPGTMIDKILHANKKRQGGLKEFLKHFKILVVDEADEFLKAQGKRKRSKSRMQRSGFGNLFDQLKMITTDITEAIGEAQFQTLLFSATYPATVKNLAVEIAKKPVIIKVDKKRVQLDNIRVFKLVCTDEVDKFNTLLRVISLANIGQMIIFVNTVNKAKQLIDGLESKETGIACSALYGRGMDIEMRDLTMEQFRKGQTQCLVASNVIARGIDVPAVSLVVNFEIPINEGQNAETGQTGMTFDSETFMHRVGRTGRFGAKGVCISLVSQDDSVGNDRLDAIQKEYSLNIDMINNDAKAIKESIQSWLVHSV